MKKITFLIILFIIINWKGYAQNCATPTMITMTTVSPTTIDLDWTDNAGANVWEIEYGNTGFVLGTGNFLTVGSKPATITGLTAGATYDFCVKAICSFVDSSLSSCDTLTTNIPKNKINNNFSIYPNPNKGEFTIALDRFDAEKLEIKINNVHGQIVYSRTNFKNLIDVNREIYLNNKSKGVYFITVTTSETVVIKKMVIQ